MPMILSNQTGYVLIPSTLLSNMTYVVPHQQMTIAACVNDPSFLYEHVIGALDSLYSKVHILSCALSYITVELIGCIQ